MKLLMLVLLPLIVVARVTTYGPGTATIWESENDRDIHYEYGNVGINTYPSDKNINAELEVSGTISGTNLNLSGSVTATGGTFTSLDVSGPISGTTLYGSTHVSSPLMSATNLNISNHITATTLAVSESITGPIQMLALTNTSTPSSFTTLQDVQNIFHSTGVFSDDPLFDNGDGTVKVLAGQGSIRSTNSAFGDLYFANWPETDLALTDQATNYIYAQWVGETSDLSVIASTSTLSDVHTNIYMGSVFRDGTTLHLTGQRRGSVQDHAQNMLIRMRETMPYQRVNGGTIGETGTRNITVSAGNWWEGLVNFSTAAIDTSAADTFSYWYQDGAGGFTKVVSQTQIDNTQYDDTSGSLATLTANRYGVHWVYMEYSGEIHILYGLGNYGQTDAESSTSPSSKPGLLTDNSRLLGRIIVQKGSETFHDIASVFDETFNVTASTDHGTLSGIGDDDHTQYVLVDGSRAMTNDLTFSSNFGLVSGGSNLYFDGTGGTVYLRPGSVGGGTSTNISLGFGTDEIIVDANDWNVDSSGNANFAGTLDVDGNSTLGTSGVDQTTIYGQLLLPSATSQADSVEFGTGANLANLYRSGNDNLKTDDSFEVAVDLLVTGDATVGGLSTSGHVTATLGITSSAYISAPLVYGALANNNISQFTNDSSYLTTVDISANTNLAVTDPIVLTDDTLSFNDPGYLLNGSIWTSASSNVYVEGVNVGIGDATPLAPLEIRFENTTNYDPASMGYADQALEITNDGGDNNKYTGISLGQANAGNNPFGVIGVVAEGDNDFGAMVFGLRESTFTNGYEIMRIDHDGMVGIDSTGGGNNPDDMLHIKAAANPAIRIDEAGSDGSYLLLEDTQSTQAVIAKVTASGSALIDFNPIPSDGTSLAAFRFFRQSGTSGGGRVDYFDGSGATINTRINTGTDQNTYMVDNGGNFALADSTPDAKFEVSLDGVSEAAVMVSSDDANDGDLFIIDSAGNVGIGTATTSAKLDVNGIVESTGLTTSGIVTATTRVSTAELCDENGLNCNDVSAGLGGGSSLWTDGGTTTYLTATGDNVGIGTTSAGHKFEVDGNIRQTYGTATTRVIGPEAATSDNNGDGLWILGGFGFASTATNSDGGGVLINGGAGYCTGGLCGGQGGDVTIRGGAADGLGVGGDIIIDGGDNAALDGDVLIQTVNSGNVGIGAGAATPAFQLEVSGSVGISATSRTGTYNVDIGNTSTVLNSAYTSVVQGIHMSPGVNPRFTAEGTTAAGLDLVDSNSATDEKHFQIVNFGGDMKMRAVADSGASVAEENIITADLTNGNVGIGVASADLAFKVEGGAMASNACTGQTLTADNQTLTSAACNGVFFDSNNGTATNRTFILQQSPVAGHKITICLQTNAAQIIDGSSNSGGGVNILDATWSMSAGDCLSLMSNGTDWHEFSRADH